MTKKEEIVMYGESYLFAFGKDRSFFFNNDFDTILYFLNENYFCEGLYYRTKLLSTLLHNDSLILPDKKQRKDFLEKSEKINVYLKQLPI